MRQLIYDSNLLGAATHLDTAGQVVNQPLVTTPGTPVRTYPVRLSGGEEEDRHIGYEFLYTVDDNASALDLRWYQEFYNDILVVVPTVEQGRRAYPTIRNWPGVDTNAPWSREQDEVSTASGAITHTSITRTMSMTGQANGDSRYLVFNVHALWTRLCLWVNGAIPTAARLRIFAHAGGHAEDVYAAQNGHLVYAYNVY